MPFDNALTRKLGMRIPVVQGGLQQAAHAELTAAVSNIGKLGIVSTTAASNEVLKSDEYM
ncbi:hypothetical protein ONS96_012341 [Cadophora gregata f. sp. sojae]|nr:hypothetical protein ONS96_012341 [Cadophora gregata f. sp. sojae]